MSESARQHVHVHGNVTDDPVAPTPSPFFSSLSLLPLATPTDSLRPDEPYEMRPDSFLTHTNANTRENENVCVYMCLFACVCLWVCCNIYSSADSYLCRCFCCCRLSSHRNATTTVQAHHHFAEGDDEGGGGRNGQGIHFSQCIDAQCMWMQHEQFEQMQIRISWMSNWIRKCKRFWVKNYLNYSLLSLSLPLSRSLSLFFNASL